MKKLFFLSAAFLLIAYGCTNDDITISEELQKQDTQFEFSEKNNTNGVIHHVSAGTNDACEAFGFEPGCDKSLSMVANMMADGTVKGQFVDGWGNGRDAAHFGVHGDIIDMVVEYNKAKVLGVVRKGVHPNYGDITGWYFISLLIDNGTSKNDEPDLISGTFVNPTDFFPFVFPNLTIEDYATYPIMQGQVKIQ
jgi:hypothetical protein